jgi:UDP-glucose 6-dehydrogenase
MTIGFIGQGYVGGTYADYFEARGFVPVRYSLDPLHIGNKDKLADCHIVFICVPTPTTVAGFDCSVVTESLSLIRRGGVVVIKSTLIPGTTERLQKSFPLLTILHSPEFLSVATAARDAAEPWGNIIGVGANTPDHDAAARVVHAILPDAPFELTCSGTQAELIKYAHNVSAVMQILTMNAVYDVAKAKGADWGAISAAIGADPYIPTRYSNPVHNGKRGAGGGCFIKDFAAFAEMSGEPFLQEAKYYNRALLTASDKDLDVLSAVFSGGGLTPPEK